MYVYTWKTISALTTWKQTAIIPSTQSKTINRQTQENDITLNEECILGHLFSWRTFEIKKKKEKPIYESSFQQNSPVWDWHFGVLWINQLDLQWHRPTCVCPGTPPQYPWREGLSASMIATVFPHTHNLYIFAWTKCTQMQHHSTKVTSHSLQTIMTQTVLWKPIPGANVWLFY